MLPPRIHSRGRRVMQHRTSRQVKNIRNSIYEGIVEKRSSMRAALERSHPRHAFAQNTAGDQVAPKRRRPVTINVITSEDIRRKLPIIARLTSPSIVALLHNSSSLHQKAHWTGLKTGLRSRIPYPIHRKRKRTLGILAPASSATSSYILFGVSETEPTRTIQPPC